MDAKTTTGAWLVHHTNKLREVTGGAAHEYENISAAGKMAQLLSGLAADDQQINMDYSRVDAIAKASGINSLERNALLDELHARKLIQKGATTISILGVTTTSVLSHAATAFAEKNPSAYERAAVELAERASTAPLDTVTAAEYLGDTYQLTKHQAGELLDQSESIGFVDSEPLDSTTKLLFNGNLFRRQSAQKIQKVLASLKPDEIGKVQQLEEQLKEQGCLELTDVKAQLGVALFEKLQSIGMFDVSEVSNEKERVLYVTRPAAFSKFGDPLVEDAMDLAKAFVAALKYGMTRSPASTGKISFLAALMRKLIAGEWTNEATAIGRDYKILEMKGVIQTRPGPGGWGFQMRLLKKEIGVLALQVLTEGDASEQSLALPGAAVTKYRGPEETRTSVRQKTKSVGASTKAQAECLLALRTGNVK